jgi:hypothetical protein
MRDSLAEILSDIYAIELEEALEIIMKEQD